MPKNENYYIIIGPGEIDEEQLHWNANKNEWTPDIDSATHYDRSIFTGPLPPDTVCIQEYNGITPIGNPYFLLPQWEVHTTL